MTSHFSPQLPNRRDVLKKTCCGFGYLAWASLAAESAAAETSNPLAPKPPHFPPRAKRVIFLFMRGGPSQMDSFDYKPQLQKKDGEKNGKSKNKLLGSPWTFRRRGQSGLWISDLFPHLAEQADDLCILRSMQTDSSAHPQAMPLLHTGSFQFRRPSLGSWVLYGLGTDNRNLPGFMTINPSRVFGGPSNYGSAFLPAAYQAARIGWERKSLKDARIPNLNSSRIPETVRQEQLELIQSLNRRVADHQPHHEELEGVINSYELGPRMAETVPEAIDLTRESKQTLEMYGVDQKRTDTFGRQCLMARRLAEAGVRFIQLNDGSWDQHSNLPKGHGRRAEAVDRPIAALLADLKRRGLLEDTLVVWGGEFGRTPEAQNEDGRNHLADGFSFWLAGGGVEGGSTYGETDELGRKVAENPVHIHDLHATILYLLGMDHTKLTYRYAGRDFRLTDVHGHVVRDILA